MNLCNIVFYVPLFLGGNDILIYIYGIFQYLQVHVLWFNYTSFQYCFTAEWHKFVILHFSMNNKGNCSVISIPTADE